ncbi:hypothetical protein [Flavobacterium branchiophilum]|uniref:Uncharacterized protein n=1 Tax=Flavobacterium branchiophilum TaxID=55197 RepID=A0A543G5V4_9FLAO|nr:hypothetical protein [Flavobacterium branchiophilum]TQM41458.1 hypothetical protein BC670_2424 [Flavobacterium branchiophilum]GEM54159.1 hypothetical protein FB1_03800 [Flavobacterium branchiophilum NBRC 15030 = ATCC 35035]
MENKKFNAKDFLNVSTLSPLESAEILGGMADKVVTTTVEVKVTVSVSIITSSGE